MSPQVKHYPFPIGPRRKKILLSQCYPDVLTEPLKVFLDVRHVVRLLILLEENFPDVHTVEELLNLSPKVLLEVPSFGKGYLKALQNSIRHIGLL